MELTVDFQEEKFYAGMSKSGRITIPKKIVEQYLRRFQSLARKTGKVVLNPVLNRDERHKGLVVRVDFSVLIGC